MKTKSIKKINPDRKNSWLEKEKQLREALKNATSKNKKRALMKQIKHAIRKQKKSETHWN